MQYLICAAIVVAVTASASVLAGECCQHCQSQCECQKVCRLVCETKKVTKIEFGCKCEDFCVPGPSQRHVCYDECGKKHETFTPTCAEVRTKKVLVKKENVQEKPSYKWVVEKVCDNCARNCVAENAQQAAKATVAGVPVPLPPQTDVRQASAIGPLTDRPSGSQKLDLGAQLHCVFDPILPRR